MPQSSGQAMKMGVGLYGDYGHQIAGKLVDHPHFYLAGYSHIAAGSLPPGLLRSSTGMAAESLDELLKNPAVKLVSLCSSRRADQAMLAMQCLHAGRHVLAEKPCAMNPAELDMLMTTALEARLVLREMANDIGWQQPYLALRRVIESGRIGTVLQVFVQKSYPMHGGRPDDEETDGGLMLQCAGHCLRMIEQVAGKRIEFIDGVEICRPGQSSGLRIAASLMMRLECGATAAAVANYLNPPAFGLWGNEHLRVFGSDGMVEIIDGGQYTRLYANGTVSALLQDEPGKDQLDLLVEEIQRGINRDDLERQLHPTRMAMAARVAARQR